MEKLIDWSDELSVGIEEIDNQHKILVDPVNQMHEAIIQHKASSVVNEILDRLIDYTRIHFAVEESLMRILHYPDYEKHKEQHDELTREVFELKKKVDEGKVAIGFELMHFLKVWLTEHIMKDDKAYAPYFLEQGIKPRLQKRSWLGKLWEHLH